MKTTECDCELKEITKFEALDEKLNRIFIKIQEIEAKLDYFSEENEAEKLKMEEDRLQDRKMSLEYDRQNHYKRQEEERRFFRGF